LYGKQVLQIKHFRMNYFRLSLFVENQSLATNQFFYSFMYSFLILFNIYSLFSPFPSVVYLLTKDSLLWFVRVHNKGWLKEMREDEGEEGNFGWRLANHFSLIHPLLLGWFVTRPRDDALENSWNFQIVACIWMNNLSMDKRTVLQRTSRGKKGLSWLKYVIFNNSLRPTSFLG